MSCREDHEEFIAQLEKSAGVTSCEDGRRVSLVEIIAELKRKADKYDAIVAEARSEPMLRKTFPAGRG